MASNLFKILLVALVLLAAVVVASVLLLRRQHKDDDHQATSNANRNPLVPKEWTIEAAPWFFDDHVQGRSNLTLLLIGNSYVWYNNLTHMVQTLLEEGADDSENSSNVTVRRYSKGGDSLEDHYYVVVEDYQPTAFEAAMGFDPLELRDLLVTNPLPWDWVILQESSRVPGYYDSKDYSRKDLWNQSLSSCQGLDRLIQELPAARTMFYQTWGRRDGDEQNPYLYPDFPTMQAKLTKGYQLYQETTSTPQRPTFIAPVGQVFETIYLRNSTPESEDQKEEIPFFDKLFHMDGGHPSLLGSYAAALTICSSIVGKDPRSMTWYPQGLTLKEAIYIQHAVARTIQDTASSGEIAYPWQELPLTASRVVSVP